MNRTRSTKSTITARIIWTERANSSVNGNPAYWLTLDNGMRVRTATDSSIAYAITNPEYSGAAHRDIPAPLLRLTLSAAGRVMNAEPVEA